MVNGSSGLTRAKHFTVYKKLNGMFGKMGVPKVGEEKIDSQLSNNLLELKK